MKTRNNLKIKKLYKNPIYRTSINNSVKIRYALPIPGTTMFQHKFCNEIIFGKIYESINEFCYGERYKVLEAFSAIKKNQYEDDYRFTMVKIQFIDTCTEDTVPYSQFKTGDLFDPYYCYMYNGNCCIGNVDTGYYKDYYNCWEEIMRRLFDPTHPLYCYFGGIGLMIASVQFRCFEFYLKFCLESIANGIIPPTDPNDRILYYNNKPMTYKDANLLNRMPYENYIPDDMSYSTKIANLPIQQRIRKELMPDGYRHPGRPKGSKNKPKQLYRLINK